MNINATNNLYQSSPSPNADAECEEYEYNHVQ